jgi:photosystem II stability/assembly factor-like uncharacterized protein
MRKLKVLILMILVVLSNKVNAQWITQNAPYINDTINTSCWLNASTVFVTGKRNMIIKSDNAGITWTNKNSGVNASDYDGSNIKSIKFLDSQTGFAGSTLMYRTTNGGNNWSLTSSSVFDEYIFVSGSISYAVKKVSSKRTLFKSTDGGASWTPKDTILQNTSQIIFPDALTGFLSSNNKIYKTTNEGVSWLNVLDNSAFTINEFSFEDINNGIILNGAGIVKTTDGGTTWSSTITTPIISYKFSFYKNDLLMFFSPRDIYTPTSNICYSSDNGTTFSAKSVAIPFLSYYGDLIRFSFYNRDIGLMLADRSKLYQTTNFGSTFENYSSSKGISTNMHSICLFGPDEVILPSDSCVWRSSNGGTNWVKISQGQSFFDMSFMDYNTGYAISNKVYKTTNHGINWTDLPIISAMYSPKYDKMKIAGNTVFGQISYGYAGGGNIVYFFDEIYKTQNDGTNWTKILSGGGSGSPSGSSSNTYDDFWFIDANTGFTILNHSSGSPTSSSASCEVLKTTNGGTNWFAQFSKDSCILNQLYFLNASTGFFSISTPRGTVSQGKGIFKTTNGGTNWTFLTSFYAENFIFTNEYTAYTPGFGSSDGGVNWVQQFSPHSPTAIKFINNYTGYIVGNEGAIYKTTNAGGLNVGVNQISAEVPDKFSLSQNYPNPFNPSTKINYELKNTNYVSLKVFDLLGKEVATLVNEKQSAGSYAVDFNSAEFNLPSGIYFYTLNAGEFKETRRMILIK